MTPNRILLSSVVTAMCVGSAMALACDPPRGVRVTSPAAAAARNDCQRAALLHSLESLRSPVHARVVLCRDELAAADGAAAAAKQDRDQSAERLERALEGVE